MYTNVCFLLLMIFGYSLVFSCLITNCPRGGRKRSEKIEILENDVQPCASCGPGLSGQCFGPKICCGTFGCLIGTKDSLKCKHNFFHDQEPCIAGVMPCKEKLGRCATHNICCSQDSCFIDNSCIMNDTPPNLSKKNVPSSIYEILQSNTDYIFNN